MRFFVTGTRGFLAPHLINKLLELGHEVTALIRHSNGMETDILDVVSKQNFDKINFVYGDLLDRDSLYKIFSGKQVYSGCFHAAAQSHPPTSFLNPLDTYRTNVIGTANLVDVIEKTLGKFCKICLISTSEVYGNAGSDGREIKETEPMNPSNPYGASKAAMELLFLERVKNDKVSGFVTRAFSHTGSRRGKNFSISSDAYQLAKFMIEENNRSDSDKIVPYKLLVGNLETTRCVMSVEDCARGYIELMFRHSNGEIFNIGSTEPRKMRFFTDKLIELSGLIVEKEISDKLYRPIDIACQIPDVSKLKLLTGWQCKIPIEQTLRNLLNYWLKKLS